MAAHVLREFWVTKAEPAPAPEAKETDSPGPVSPPAGGIQSLLEGLARQLDGKKPELTTTLKFDFKEEGVFRLVIEQGVCRIEPGDGEAAASMQIKWKDAQKLFAGKLDPMVAMVSGKIKTKGDARAFMILQEN